MKKKDFKGLLKSIDQMRKIHRKRLELKRVKKIIESKSKNAKLLKDFTRYCDKHPNERFYQALRNWSGFSYD